MTDAQMQSGLELAVEALLAGENDKVVVSMKHLLNWFHQSQREIKDKYRVLNMAFKILNHSNSPEAIVIMASLYAHLYGRYAHPNALSGAMMYAYSFYYKQKKQPCAYTEGCFSLFIDTFDAVNDQKKLSYGDMSFLLEASYSVQKALHPQDRAARGKLNFLLIECTKVLGKGV